MQETAAGHSCQDPGPALPGPPAPEPGLLAGRLAGALPGGRAVHQHRLLPALLPAGVVHVGGARGPAHVPEHRAGVHAVPQQIHAQVLTDRLGWVTLRSYMCL